MDIYAKKGTKVKYTGCTDAQVKFAAHDDPRDVLEVDGIYTILKTEVHSWHTKVILQEFPTYKFNSVCFEDVDDSN
jgi:hypothetical protein